MRVPAREWRSLGCAAFLGALVAFPIGVIVSGREPVQPAASDPKRTAAPAGHSAESRQQYSPNILGDPYVHQRHREIVEALEAACRGTGKGCVEARQARRYLDEREATPTQ